MKIIAHSATHIGLVRTENQDTVFSDINNRIFIVADGMGGHRGGKVASQLAVEVISNKLNNFLKTQNKESSVSSELREAYKEANKAVYSKGQKHSHLQGMGTTVCAFFIQEDHTAYIGNVGDSRLYMSKNNHLWQLTEDHTFANNQLKISLMTKEKMPSAFIDDHILTKSVGFTASVEPDIFKKKVERDEIYMMCSDGLSGLVSNQEIEDILNTYPVERIPDNCIQRALKAGGMDNISVLAIEIQ